MSRFGLTLVILLSLNWGLSQGNWVWKNGSNVAGQPSNFGTMGVSSPTNHPGARYQCAEWTDNNGIFWLYGGGMGTTRYSGLWRFDPTTEEWTFMHGSTTNNAPIVYGTQGVSNPANTPGGLGFCAATWTDLAGDLWLYGGNDGGNAPSSVLWKYSILTNEWTWVQGNLTTNNPPVYGVQGVSSPSNTPGVRLETSCTWTDTNGNLWLFGGTISGAGDTRNDLWKYDPITNEWTWMKGSAGPTAPGVYGVQGISNPANTPGARWCYTHWTDVNGDLWLFGGIDASTMILFGMYNDLWKYDISTNEWTWMNGSTQQNAPSNYGSQCVSSVNNSPPARGESRACWTDNCGNFWMFGGRNSAHDYFNDLWRYNPTINEWTWVHGSNNTNQAGIYGTINVPNPSNAPGGKMGSVGWSNEMGLWLFGGEANGEFNDLWLYYDTVNADFAINSTINCDEFDFVDQSTTGCDSISSYSWNFGDPGSGAQNIDNLQNPNHIFSGSGTYSVTLIVNSCAGGADTSIQSVQVVNCGLSITLENDTICVGDCIDLIVSSNTNTDSLIYLWNNQINVNNDTVQVCPITSTSYTVIATDLNGDIDSATALITVLPYPQVDLGSDTIICNGNLTLDAGNNGANFLWQNGSTTQTITVNNSGIYSVQVNNGGCISYDSIDVQVNGPSVDLGPDTTFCSGSFLEDVSCLSCTYLWQDGSTLPFYTISDTGTFYVSVTDQYGCMANDTLIVTPLVLSIDLGQDTIICSGQSVLLSSSISGVNYLWSTGSTTSSILVSTADIYTLEITEGICTAVDSIEVNIEHPITEFAVSDTVGCAPQVVNFTDLTSSVFNIQNWDWDFGDGNQSNLQHPSHVYSSSGTYLVVLTTTTSIGCSSVSTKPVTVEIYQTPIASFTFDPLNPEMNEQVSFTDQSTNASTWDWNFGDGHTSIDQHPVHSFDTEGDLMITLIVSNHNCVDSTIIYVSVQNDLVYYVPNAFTPDGDEHNNIFLPVFTSGFDPSDYHLTIFNRWGEIIFESVDSSIGWDGTYSNHGMVQVAVYTWQIEFGDRKYGTRYLKMGHVTMLK